MPAHISEADATSIAAVAQKIITLVRAESEQLVDGGLGRDAAYRLVMNAAVVAVAGIHHSLGFDDEEQLIKALRSSLRGDCDYFVGIN